MATEGNGKVGSVGLAGGLLLLSPSICLLMGCPPCLMVGLALPPAIGAIHHDCQLYVWQAKAQRLLHIAACVQPSAAAEGFERVPTAII